MSRKVVLPGDLLGVDSLSCHTQRTLIRSLYTRNTGDGGLVAEPVTARLRRWLLLRQQVPYRQDSHEYDRALYSFKLSRQVSH